MMVCSLCASAALAAAVVADFDSPQGAVRPLHGVNCSPMRHESADRIYDQSQTELAAAGIPYCRLHDVGGRYALGHYVDVPNVFPDFDADENDPKSYDFDFTDAYLKTMVKVGVRPYYRLGVTIEGLCEIKPYAIVPPKDPAKWARICEHIIAHYNEGWANGYRWNLEYWEIWNEPEPNWSMWYKGTQEGFFALYETAAKHLKKRFPNIKVGGYGSIGFYAVDQPDHPVFGSGTNVCCNTTKYAEQFLMRMKERGAPLDFFSWHLYLKPPYPIERVAVHADYCRRLLDRCGFPKAESHFNEWNVIGDVNMDKSEKDWDAIKEAPIAAQVAATFITMQGAPIDKAMYYCALPNARYCGMFYWPSGRTTPVYEAFRAFNELYRLGQSVRVKTEGDGLYALAATGEGKEAVLIVNASPKATSVSLDVKGAGTRFSVRRIDPDHPKMSEIGSWSAGSPLTLPASSITLLTTLASDGVTFDFDRLSAEKFRGELSTPDLAVKATWTANKPPHAVQERKDGIWSTTVATNAPDRQVSSWWATVPVGPNPDGLRVRVSFSYRSHRAPGRLGNTYCIPNDQRGPETYETFTLATTDDKWHFFARDFRIAPGVKTFRLHQRLDGPGDFEFKDLSIRPVVADATKPPVTVTAMPYGFLGREFAVPSNQCAIVAYSWSRADPQPEAAARDYVFTYELDPGFEPVEPLFGDRDSVRIVRRADGGTVVSVVSDRKPPRDPSFGNWDRFGFVVATSAPVGTRGKARLSCTCRGEPCSNVEELELFVVPEIRAKRTDGYRIGVSDSGIGWMRPRTERGRKAVARLMADSGVGYVLTSDSAQIPYLREAGIGQVIHNGIRARNGFEIGIGRPIPADERFVALNPKSRAGTSDAVCPASVYLEKPFFVTNTLETFRRQLKGFDGAQINWEPYYYAGQGCMCDTCCREFAKWANLDYADVKRDWPACVVRKTGRFGGRIREFRCWQHGRLMGTLNRYVTAFTGGDTSTGFIPEVECGMATSNRRDVRLFDETDVESYVRDLRWINFWGPYSGIWDMRSPYVHRPEEWVLDFHYARNVGRAMKTDHPDLRIEGGFIITGSWMIEPEILELNLKAQFFNRWDASVVFQYPSGLDARHWAALANAASCAAEYGDVVRNGRRIDGTVVLTPSAGFPKPVRAANRHVPEYDNVSLLQHVAYERNGRRLVAVFNYRADGPAEFILRFTDRGIERSCTVPAAHCAVLEFGGK